MGEITPLFVCALLGRRRPWHTPASWRSDGSLFWQREPCVFVLLVPRVFVVCVMHCAAAAEAAAAAVKSGARGGWKGHAGAVSGIGVDAVNKTMVSAGVDGLLVFWAFKEKRADGAVAVGSGVSQLELVRMEGPNGGGVVVILHVTVASTIDLAFLMRDGGIFRVFSRLRPPFGKMTSRAREGEQGHCPVVRTLVRLFGVLMERRATTSLGTVFAAGGTSTCGVYTQCPNISHPVTPYQNVLEWSIRVPRCVD